MRQGIRAGLAAVGLVAGFAGSASAQPNYGPYSPTGNGFNQVGPGGGGYAPTPGLNPYLNFAIGRSAAVNYFNAVQPYTAAGGYYGGVGGYGQMYGRRQTFFPGAVPLDTDLPPDFERDLAPAGRTPTGHPVVFGYYSGYFNSTGTGGGAPGGWRPGQNQTNRQGSGGTAPGTGAGGVPRTR
jgi:hypothetical protein